jgi:hypothetical protein
MPSWRTASERSSGDFSPGGRREHALLVARHHERAKDLALDVDIR